MIFSKKISINLTAILAASLSVVVQEAAQGFALGLEDRIDNLGVRIPLLNEADFLWRLDLNPGENINAGDSLLIRYFPSLENTLSGPRPGIVYENPVIDRLGAFRCGSSRFNAAEDCADFFFNPLPTGYQIPSVEPSSGASLVELVFPFVAERNYSPTETVSLGYFRTISTADLNPPPPFAYFGPVTAELRDSSGNLRFSAIAGGTGGQSQPFNSKVVKSALPIPGSLIPDPRKVPGKEYSDRNDKNEQGEADPEQTLLWDGSGGVKDGFSYSSNGEVDAIANVSDTLFDTVINNEAALLFSTTGDRSAPIMFESIGGGGSIWATPPEIDRQGVNDLDGLEVWGPEESPNANQYSLLDDPNGLAVLSNTSGGGSVEFTVAELAAAISLPQEFWGQFDLDALMLNDEEILFSIAPVGNFDGGEIWYWNKAKGGTAEFLNHGGHLWNTEFNIMKVFGTTSENVDALEAVSSRVPESDSIFSFLALGTLGTALAIKRKKNQKSIEKNKIYNNEIIEF